MLVSPEYIADAVSDVAIAPSFLSYKSFQIIAYYNINRLLSVAVKDLATGLWKYWSTHSFVKWDSHNYIDLGVDASGMLHIAGNMHSSQLEYYILDIHSEYSKPLKVDYLIDENREQKITYPRFMKDVDGSLLFAYRDGLSGDGDFIVLRWDEKRKVHRLLSEKPIISGEGRRNAYIDTNAPILGPDGRWHLVWVWRDTPDAETTHTVNYAISDDLIKWKSAQSESLPSPILHNEITVVDPVSEGHGLINNNVKVGFTAKKSPIIFYHKNDDKGSQQLWRAVLVNEKWEIASVSNWNFTWRFHGAGSLDFKIELDSPRTTSVGVSIDVRINENVKTFNFNNDGKLLSVVEATGRSSVGRTVRPDGLLLQTVRPQYWTQSASVADWFVSYATVPDLRDRKPKFDVPTSFPMTISKI